MPTCIFILSRFALRVDHVLFRIFDTRIYCSFASSPPLIVRETSGWEAPYERVKRVCTLDHCFCNPPSRYPQLLPRRDDLTPLTDPGWVAQILTGMPKHVTQEEGGGTNWRGLGSTREVAILS